MLVAFKEVFSNFYYVSISLIIAIVIFTIAVIFPNIGFVKAVIIMDGISLYDKALLVFSLYGAIQTNFSLFSATYTILISIMFGVNISLLVFIIKKRAGVRFGKNTSTNYFGLIAGALGIGCSACGSLLLTSLLPFLGLGSFLAILPFGGEEFGIISVVILIYTTVSLSKQINKPQVCVV